MIALGRRLLGLLLVVLIVGFLTTTVLVYEKVFTPVVAVTLETDTAGNEMNPGDDVKVRGMLVGTVRSISSTGDGAVLDLALEPGLVNQIPSNVTAELLPSTLFGPRYVDLEIPASASPTPIAAGAVIGQNRSAAAIEVEKVLDDLLPVLQAVQPEKLASTLTAISTALRGQGPQLRQTIDQLAGYVGQLNPQLPTLEHDLTALAQVTDTYDQAAPDLINALSDLTVTSQTIANQASQLSALYSTLTTASDNLENFLSANRNNLIQLAANSRPTLNTLAGTRRNTPASWNRWRATRSGSTRRSAPAPTNPGCTPPSRSRSVAANTCPAWTPPPTRTAAARVASTSTRCQTPSRSTRRTARCGTGPATRRPRGPLRCRRTARSPARPRR